MIVKLILSLMAEIVINCLIILTIASVRGLSGLTTKTKQSSTFAFSMATTISYQMMKDTAGVSLSTPGMKLVCLEMSKKSH